MKNITIVAGMGEVGKPLHTILSRVYECVGVDVEPIEIDKPCDVLHVCYPSQVRDFVEITAAYVKKYQPKLVIINSTLPVGTTRKVEERVGVPVVYSPVRGKHVKMEKDMLRYKKFVAGNDVRSTNLAKEHFEGAGFQVGTFRTPDVAEVSKLMETTWLGVLIGWAQEIERISGQCGASYEEVNTFIEEIDFLPSHVFPGHIGGHCVMANIAILRQQFSSKFLDVIVESNDAKGRSLKAQQPTASATNEELEKDARAVS